MSEEQREKNRATILDYDRWTQWPILPVKQTNGSGEIGFLVAVMSETRKIYKMNMWDLKRGALAPQLKDCPFIEYEDVDKMLDAGWVVD